MKVKVGPIQVTYAGVAKFLEKDEAARRIVLDASGKEARGSGTAAATITSALVDQGESTKVTVTTDLQITGKPAQFGRGVMVEVGNKLLDRFAACLEEEIGVGDAAAAAAPTTEDASPTAGTPAAGGPDTGSTVGDIAAATAASTPQARPAAVPPLRRNADDDAIDLLDTAGLPVLKRLVPVAIALVVLLLVVRRLRRRR